MANGRFIKIENLEVSPKLQEEEAIQIALDKTGASKYAWESEGMEKMLKEETGDETATYYPEAELLIWHPYRENETHLAYKIKVYSLEPYNHEYIYVDASNGLILDRDPIAIFSSATGTADTRYSSTQTLKTDSYSSIYRLRDPSRGNGIETYDMNEGTDFSNAVDFTDSDNNWTATEWHNTEMDDAALDAHWALQKIYDYFDDEHSRQSYDDADAKIKCYVHYRPNWDNAQWDDDRILLGDGDDDYRILASFDVIAHEFGHGVCQETCDLEYEGESGAINEGLSDIWAATIEEYCVPQKQEWRIGEEITLNTTALRAMDNPNLFGQPDTYGGTFWINPDCGTPTLYNDYCGVHTNSGVMNHWFYLLSAGDGNAHTNDNGDCYFVEGIGIEDAAEIVYSLEADYLDNESDFDDARTLSIQLARNLNEEIQITNAWYAVGVGEQFNDYPISGPSLICSGEYYYVDNLPSGATVNWDISPTYSVFQLTEDAPSTNQVIVHNQGWYSATTTLVASVDVGCDEPLVLTKTIANDNDNSSVQYGSYYQEACSAYNNSFPSQSGTLNGNSVFLYPGCMTEITLSNMFGRTVSLASGSAQPLNWLYLSSNSTLYLQLPNQPGVPFLFNITGDGACYDKTLVFFAYSGYSLLISPNPTSGETTISIEKIDSQELLNSTTSETIINNDAEWDMEVYDSLQNLKQKKNKLKGNSAKINTQSWKEGVYMVRVKYKNEVLTGKLVVKK